MKIRERIRIGDTAKTEIKKYLPVFLYCALALSLWSNFLITKVLGIKLFVYEVYFLPLIAVYFYLNRRRYIPEDFSASFPKKDKKAFVLKCAELLWSNVKKLLESIPLFAYVTAAVLLLFLIIGMLRSPGYITSQVTSYRVWFYFLAIITICFALKEIDLKLIYFSCLGAVFGDLLFCIITPNDQTITQVNLVALAAVICIPLVCSNYYWFAASIALGGIEAFVSGFRITFVVVAVTYLFGILYTAVCTREKKNYILLAVTVGGGILFIVFFDGIASLMQNVFHMDNYAFFRVTSRLKALLRFDFAASQDAQRLKCFSAPFELFAERVIPRGLIGKANGTYGTYKDVPIVFLYDSFGAIAAWFLSAFTGFIGAWNLYASYKKRTDTAQAFFGAMFPVIVLMFLLNGCFLMDTYEVCISAVIFGFWFRYYFGIKEQKSISPD